MLAEFLTGPEFAVWSAQRGRGLPHPDSTGHNAILMFPCGTICYKEVGQWTVSPPPQHPEKALIAKRHYWEVYQSLIEQEYAKLKGAVRPGSEDSFYAWPDWLCGAQPSNDLFACLDHFKEVHAGISAHIEILDAEWDQLTGRLVRERLEAERYAERSSLDYAIRAHSLNPNSNNPVLRGIRR